MKINPISNINICRQCKSVNKQQPVLNSKPEDCFTYSNNVSFKRNKAYTLLMGGSSGAIAATAIFSAGSSSMTAIPFVSLSALCLFIGFVIDRAREKD